MPLIDHLVPGLLSASLADDSVRTGQRYALQFLHPHPEAIYTIAPVHPAQSLLEVGRVVVGRVDKVTKTTVHLALESTILQGWVPPSPEVVILRRASHAVISGLAARNGHVAVARLLGQEGERTAISRHCDAEYAAGRRIAKRLSKLWVARQHAERIHAAALRLCSATWQASGVDDATVDKAIAAVWSNLDAASEALVELDRLINGQRGAPSEVKPS